jgi:uncharacterized RDD family membrane protein YckC
MKVIEISTTQNVTIEYQLASIGKRILAFSIDFAVVWASILVFFLIFTSFSLDEKYFFYFQYLIMFPVFFFYTLTAEILMDGQTLGKKAMKIKVVKLNGKEAGFSDYLTRWSLRMVDIYFSIGSIACFLISSSNLSQRFGDLLSGTVVINLNIENQITLASLVNLQKLENYTPKFPTVKNFDEDDIIFIKNAFEQINKFPNKAHLEAFEELVEKIKQQLQIAEPIQNKPEFIRTIIKDYIVLTR